MNPSFKPSINIKYDFKVNDLIDYYIPTPTHVEVINSICESILYSKVQNNQIIIGAYGTGKSLLGLLVANLLSQNFSNSEFKALKKSFAKYDDKIENNLTKINRSTMKFIPVFINGNEGFFHNAILLNTYEALKQHNINVNIPNHSTAILSTVERWKIEYPLSYDYFVKLLLEQGKSINSFINEIEKLDEHTISLFEELYSKVTSGAIFNSQTNGNFITQIESILQQVKEQGYGIVFIYDEFGRFLQTLPEDKTHSTMQYIQDFAELLDHGLDNGRLILISHKDLRQYFNEDSIYRDEFQRIEKRFKKQYIYSNPNMFYSIAEKIISSLRKNIMNPLELEYQLSNLRKFPIFPLNRTELQTVVIDGCYPLHPVALSLLMPLSNAFGQNERTLFTFLDSTDSSSLKYHIQNSNEFYKSHQLFDFFFQDYNNKISVDEKYQILKIYYKNKAKIPENKDSKIYSDMINMLKFITLWKLANMHTIQSLSDDFINYALGWEINKTKQILEKLKGFRVLRFNRLYQQWEIYEGSSIDLDREIQKKINSLTLSTTDQCDIIQNLLDKRYITADQYNLNKKMIRFASIQVLTDVQLINNTQLLLQKNNKADAILNIILFTQLEQKSLIKTIQQIQHKQWNNIFCLTNKNISYLNNDLKKYIAVNQLLEDSNLLSEDPFTRIELEVELEETEYYLKQKIKELTNFSDDFVWYISQFNNSINIKSEFTFKKILSQLFYLKYNDTPIINNEAFNRRNVATVQRNASKKVIDAILQYPYEQNFNIQGFGPDYLIYATVFKNNGIMSANDLQNMPDNHLKILRLALLDHLNNNNEFNNLIRIMRQEPFGLRESVIPILLVGLLQDVWPNIMFFNKGQYISKVTSNEIYEMVQNGTQITYQINSFKDSDFEFFNQITDIFRDTVSEHVLDKSIHIQASSALLGWLQKLPKYTQTTSNQPRDLLLFKTYVRRLEVDPTDSLKWLKQQSDMIIKYKAKLDSWFEIRINDVLHEIEEKNEISMLYSWAQEKYLQNKDNKFLKTVLSCDNESPTSLINNLSYKLFEFHATEWTDSFTQTFINEITNQIHLVNEIEFDPKQYVSVQVNNETKYIIKTELSPRAKSLYDNLNRMIINSGKRITNNELEYILYKIMSDKLNSGGEA